MNSRKKNLIKLNLIRNLAFDSIDYLKFNYKNKDKFIDFENICLNKYSNRTLFDIINSTLDNNSISLYEILFELNYIPKFIETVMTSSDMFNVINTFDHHLHLNDKNIKLVIEKYIYLICLDRMRFDYYNKMFNKNIYKNKNPIEVKMDKHAIELRNMFKNFTENKVINYTWFKFKFNYGFKGLCRKFKVLKNKILFKLDYLFNDGNQIKDYVSKSIKECETVYEDSIKAIKNSIDTLNSEIIRNYIFSSDHIEDNQFIERSKSILSSIAHLTNYCENSIIKIISMLNIMKHDPYRRFR